MYSTKLKNIKEMDNFLDKYHLSKLNQKQRSKFNRPITDKEIETVIKFSQAKNKTKQNETKQQQQQKQTQGQMVSAQNSTRFSKN